MWRKMYAQVRYYYPSIPRPEDLDEEYVMQLWQDLVWIRKEEKRLTEQQT